MFFFRLLRAAFKRLGLLRKKTRILYGNTADASTGTPSLVTSSPQALTHARPPLLDTTMQTTSPDTGSDANATAAAVQAVADGVDQVTVPGRKARSRKGDGATRAAGASIKKKRAPKAPRNPFRRSETAKLQVKRLQMGKRVEVMTPRVEVLRERLDTMQSRLLFVSGKLAQVKEELASREEAPSGEVAEGALSGGVAEGAAPENAVVTMADMENVELDDEAVVPLAPVGGAIAV